MEVIVIGAGLAGLTMAISLAQAGHKVTVLESSAQITYIEAGIQLSSNSSKILRKLGIDKHILKYCTEPVDLRMMRWQGSEMLVECPLKKSALGEYGSPYWHIHRADFHRGLMARAIELGITMHLGSRVVQVGPRGTILSYLLEGINETLVNFVSTCDVNMEDGVNQKVGTNEDVREAFKGWDPRFDNMLSFVDELFTHHEIPNWAHPSNKLVLIGDAAHAMTPYLAQGAAMGIEDGAILGSILGQADYCTAEGLPEALKIYENLRIKRMAMVAEASVTSRWFTQMEDGKEQRERHEWLLSHPGIWEGHINIRSRRSFFMSYLDMIHRRS